MPAEIMNVIIHLTALSLASSDPARDVLQSASDKWFDWLVASTCVVGLGVVLEAPEGLIDLLDWFRARRQLKWVRSRTGIFSDIDPAHWSKAITFLGLVLVAAGVIGEGIFEVLVSRADSKVRIYDETKLSAAESSTQQLKTDAEIAKRDTETERLARVKIESAVAFRQLTEQEKKDIGRALGQFKSKAGASLWYPAGDVEAELFADDITEALRSGGIIVQPPAGTVTMRGSGKFNDPLVRAETGVVVQSTKVGDSPQFALAVIDELNKRGFDARRQTNPPFDSQSFTEIWINVEGRPKGPQGEYKLQAIKDAKKKNLPKNAQ
jgi:hypothetical protein